LLLCVNHTPLSVAPSRETAVKLAFTKLGWGAATAHEFDVGTDLFLLVRDQRLFDVGLMLGVQVKTGEGFLREPVRDSSGEITGWWFRDRDHEHADHWLGHVLPHILVLHDPNSGSSYWAPLRSDTVINTGHGVKILIPRANTIDESQREELVAVAASHRRVSPWEGSAWTGAVSIPHSGLLRHALLVPRLFVPRQGITTAAQPLSPRRRSPWS
jgi:hypothetical protein